MSEKRSVTVYGYWKKTSEKFDYYVTALTGALCAYVGQTFQPQKLSWSPNTLELAALLILVFSVFAGFKRVEAVMLLYRLNHRYLHCGEKIGSLKKAFKDNPRTIINEDSGEILDAEAVRMEIEKASNEIRSLLPTLENMEKKTLLWYKVRNYSLFMGFPIMLISRVLTAYAK